MYPDHLDLIEKIALFDFKASVFIIYAAWMYWGIRSFSDYAHKNYKQGIGAAGVFFMAMTGVPIALTLGAGVGIVSFIFGSLIDILIFSW